jgi:nucleoside diphosphate kinase
MGEFPGVTAAGLRVSRLRIHHTPPRQVERFHARNPYVVEDPELYAMARRLLDLGPSVALLLVGDRTGPDDIFDRLNKLKGYGEPRYALPGSLRHDLRSINTMLNLVHSAATAEELVRDREVFFDGTCADIDGEKIHAVIDDLHRLVPRETRDLAAILDGVREKAPGIDAYFSASAGPQESGIAAAGMSYVRRAGVELDRWAHLVLHTSMRFPPRLDGVRPSGPVETTDSRAATPAVG